MKSAKELLQEIEQGIKSLESTSEPRTLYEPIDYILKLGGKRFRPLLVLLTAQLRGQAVSQVDSALAIEVFHNFTLMHDDIMDNAPLRRGQPTVHEKWNPNVAILSGDTMLVQAYQLLLSLPKDMLPQAIDRFNRTAVEVCEGQQWDMDFEDESIVSEKQYLEMIRLKTAVLLGFSMELGAMLAGYDRAEQEKLYQVGMNMGIGFQLMDDYLDVYGEQAKVGKQVGGDIIANKKTYLMITALELATGDQKRVLQDWLTRESFDPGEKVTAVKRIYDDMGIPNVSKMKMDYYFDLAFKSLDEVACDDSAKEIFLDFTNALIQRDH